jgi:hypothetical protein
VTAEARELVRAAVHMFFTAALMAWALICTEDGYVPEPAQRETPALHFPRRRRTPAPHPFRTVVRCTAPPARWARSAGLQVT